MPLESLAAHELTPVLTKELETFLDGQETSHPFQFPGWADPDSKVFFLREGGTIRWAGVIGLFPALGRKFPWIRGAAAVRGPVCDDPELWQSCVEELATALIEERVCYVEVSPDWLQDRAATAHNSSWHIQNNARASLRLDLTPPEESIFANFRKNSRYEVRNAERKGATVYAATGDTEIEGFLRLYQNLAERKGFPHDELSRMRRQIRWLMNSEARGSLLVARARDEICGGAVIARAARRCWYIWGATTRTLNVGHLLQWHALQWAKQHNCTEYDFGGYTPGATSGPAWFKAGFGGKEVHFVPSLRKILQPRRYAFLRLFSR